MPGAGEAVPEGFPRQANHSPLKLSYDLTDNQSARQGTETAECGKPPCHQAGESMATIHHAAQPMWQAERMGFSGRAERNVRDLSHASVLIFALTAVVTGILAAVSLSSEIGIGMTSSFVVVAILFPLLCGWLAKERWRASKLEEQILKQESNQELLKGPVEPEDDTPSGLLILSADLKIRFANQTYLHASLHELEDVLGWKIQDVMPVEGLEERAKALLGRSDPAASCCFNAVVPAGLADDRPVHITMARIAPQRGADRLLVVVEDLEQDCVPVPDVPVEGYVC